MSDTLANALTSASHSSTVLQGIANPATLNPLAGVGTAMDMVGKMQGLDKTYAEQQFGRALQQATDEKGNVDYPAAVRIAASDPRTAYAMQTGLLHTTELQGGQLTNIGKMQAVIAGHMGTLARDPSNSNLDAIHADLLANGMPRNIADAGYARWQAMSPVERQREATRYMATSPELSGAITGRTALQNTGNQFVPLTTAPALPGYGPATTTQGQGGANAGLSPAEASQFVEHEVTEDEAREAAKRGVVLKPGTMVREPLGQALARGNYRLIAPQVYQNPGAGPGSPPGPRPPARVNSRTGPVNADNPAPVRQLNVGPQAPQAPQAPPQPPPQAPQAPPQPPPQPPPPPPPRAPFNPQSGVPTSSSLTPPSGGVQVADNALTAPTLGAPAPPNPLVAGDVSAITQGMDRAKADASPGGDKTADLYFRSRGDNERVTADLSKDLLARHGATANNYAAEVFPSMEALNAYGRGITTAPGAEPLNIVKGFAAGVARSLGFDPGRVGKEVAERDVLGKWLATISMNNPAAAKSDAMLGQVLAGNASTHIHELAGEDMVKAGMAMKRMNAIMYQRWSDMEPLEQAKYGYYYSNYARQFSRDVDPRAFAMDLYNKEQLKTLRETLGKASDRENELFEQSLKWGTDSGYVTGKRAMP